jgi:hypothetical protein
MSQVDSVLNLVDSFLTDFHEKEAAIQDRSYTEVLSGPAELEKPSASEVVTDQRGLGKEQTEEARNGGANTDSVPENKDADGNSPVDDQGPDTLDTDEELKSRSEVLGTTREQEITQEQKVARANGMANAILNVAYEAFQKDAGAKEMYEGAKKRVSGARQAVGKGVNKAVDAAKGAADDANDAIRSGKQKGRESLDRIKRTKKNKAKQGVMYPKEASMDKEAQEWLDNAVPVAQAAAEGYFYDFLEGMHKRACDEREVMASMPAEVLNRIPGGVVGLLDKVAMEYPEAVMPEGMDMAEGEDGAAGEGGAGGMEAAMEDPALEEAMAGAPAEGGMEGAEGGMGEGEVDELAAALDEAGVTEEDLAQAFQDVQALQEAGVEPEELAQALEEIAGEGAGGAEAMEGGEAPVEKLASMDKEARERIDAIKEYLTSDR